MKNRLFSARLALQAGAIALAAVLAGCGTPSIVDEHGKTDKPVFPKLEDGYALDHGDGLVINHDILVKLEPGLTRDQVYYLLGRPHFAEGFRVREWDYVLHLAGSHTGVRKPASSKCFSIRIKKRKATTGCQPTAWTARLRLHQRPSLFACRQMRCLTSIPAPCVQAPNQRWTIW